MTLELIDAMIAVAEAREELASASLQLAAKRQAFATANAPALEYEAALKVDVQRAEAAAREKLVAAFKADQGDPRNKKPVPGGGIQEPTLLKYDPEVALAWALEHKMAHTLPALDVKAFESIAVVAKPPLTFVEIHKGVEATLAKSIPLAELRALRVQRAAEELLDGKVSQ